MKKLLTFLFIITVGTALHAQTNIDMQNGTFSQCAGNFFDAGGPGTGSEYGPNENFTLTLCPSTGNFVSVDFYSFQLGTGDFLTVYDGNSTAGPLIGVFDANTVNPGLITSNPSINPSGCLTFVFTSDGTNEGNGWAGAINCNTPCQNYYIQVDSLSPDTTAQGYIDICYEDTVHYEISGDYTMNNTWYAQNDATTNFLWAVLDGQSLDTIFDTTGTIFDFPFDSAGAYYIEVAAEDAQGCANIGVFSQIVRVSTYPDFTGTSQSHDTICYGENVTLVGDVSSVGWTNYIPPFSGDSIALPDATGSNPGSYTSTMNISTFQPGQTINTVNDFGYVEVNMEHSFVGDLSITLQCPNGSQVLLKQFPGGGGNWLGEPCDNGGINQPVGVPYPYNWPANTAPVYNTIVNTANAGCTGCLNVPAFCGAGNGNALDSSSYTPASPFSNLIGCPINGAWSLTVVDQWGSDDGHLVSWNIAFDSAILPPTVISYDPGVDSAYFVNNPYANFVSQDSLVVQPTAFDTTIEYTYEMIDNFGCAYDTTMSVYVKPACDQSCCNAQVPTHVVNPVSCPQGSDGEIIVTPDVNTSPGPWTYKWFDANGNLLVQNDSISSPDTLSGLVVGTYSVEIIDSNCCTVTKNIYVNQVPQMNVNVGNLVDASCYGVGCDGSATAFVSLGTAPYNFDWTGIDSTQTANNLCAGSNSVTITDANGCIDSASFTIGEPDSIQATATGTDTICITNTTPISANAIGGTAPYTYTWNTGATGQTINVSPGVTSTFTVSVTDANNCPIDTGRVNIYVRQPLDSDVFPADTICPGDVATVSAIGYGGNGNYNYAWSNSTTGSQTGFAYTSSGYAYVTVTDGCGTPSQLDSVWIQVGGYPQLQLDVEAEPDSVCQGEPAYLSVMGRNGDGQYTYTWDNGLGQGGSKVVLPLSTTTYTVTVTDNCNTPSNFASVTVKVGDKTEINVIADPAEGCYPLTSYFKIDEFNPNFNYDFNFGDEWVRYDRKDSISHEFRRIGCNDVRVRVSTDLGCETTKVYDCMIDVWPVPTSKFSYTPFYPTILDPTVTVEDRSNGASSIVYDLENGFSTLSEDFSYTFSDTGLYQVRQVVENDFGCADTSYQFINVDHETTFYIPTAFTPNGDDLNDYFGPTGDGIQFTDFNMQIYNRWGNLVYETNSLLEPWNGKMNNTGEILENGTYIYYIRYSEHDNLDQFVHGNVNLVR